MQSSQWEKKCVTFNEIKLIETNFTETNFNEINFTEIKPTETNMSVDCWGYLPEPKLFFCTDTSN